MSITIITGENGWPMSGANVSRYIAVFKKQGEAHLKDLPFVHLPTFQMLQKAFSSDADDPMYDEDQIDARIANRLAPFIHEPLDLRQFEYFLLCDAVT